MKKLKRSIIVLMLLLFLCVIGYTVIVFGGKMIVDEKSLVLDAQTTIETADGNVVGEIYKENRIPIDLKNVPKYVKEAFVAIEDRRFYEHSGVDFRSIVRAVYRDIIAMAKVEGASTITQQLAKNLFLTNDKTWMRKTKEMMAAIELERQLSKDEILQLYLNDMYFGQGVYGIEAASQYFFSKSASDLSVAEGAMLAGLAKAPNGYSPINHPEKAKQRRNVVLHAMAATDKISSQQKEQAQDKSLGLNIKKEKEKPWIASYVDLIIQEASEQYDLSIDELKRGGFRIVVNMDDKIQQIAHKQFKNNDYFPGNSPGAQGAFVMMEQTTGKIVAAIGGRDFQIGGMNRVTVKRQPGSTMKPIAVYGPAMMQDTYQAYSLLSDQKMEIKGYEAANYDDQYDGIVSLYEALVESKNAPAVWLLNQIGVGYSKDYLAKMGIKLPDKGLSIALGGLKNGVTPLQMAQSYQAIANNGKLKDGYTIDRIYDRNDNVEHKHKANTSKVFTPQVAWDLTRILSAVVEKGTGTAGYYPKALAGKTGSTQHPHVAGMYKDAWFVGYTPNYVSALWMGYDKSDKAHYLTDGSEFPTKLTKAILTELDNEKTLTATFTKPEKVKDLPEPIKLPKDITLHARYSFGGFSIIKGKLEWNASDDERVIYRIYKVKEGIDERVGEVKGAYKYTVEAFDIFQRASYYVVPYDPLTGLEGKRSNTVELSL